jgi:outer membrane protein assembly factor BamA
LKIKFLYFLLFSIFLTPGIYSQNIDSNVVDKSSDYYLIKEIKIEGNRRTKESIIYRELSFRQGDRILKSKADSLLKWEGNKLFNTNLFITANVYKVLTENPDEIELLILLKEQWYTIPQLIFEPSDRNLNEWVLQRGTSLDRVNFGVKLFQRNVRGRNETLRLTLQSGFTQAYEISYEIPYIDKRQTIGIKPFFSYSNNRSIAYANNQHKLEFIKIPGIIRDFSKIGFGLYYRNKFFAQHVLELAYNYNTIADTVAKLNPEYFLDSRTFQRYLQLKYVFNYDKRDRRQYAHSGYIFKTEVEQLGFTNLETQQVSRLTLMYNYYKTLNRHFYLAHKLKAKTTYPNLQPFIDFKGLGYFQDYVRGFELYPIDGQSYLLSRNSFRFLAVSKIIDFGKLVPLPQFRTLPIDIYFNFFADGGIAFNDRPVRTYPLFVSDNARFSNIPIGSVGVGLHIVTFYNSVMRFEYSYNSAKELNFFFNLATDI